MSSVQRLREFIRERLTAAAEEIFTEVETTIVRYEEELHAQRRMTGIYWKPQIKLGRIGSEPQRQSSDLQEPHVSVKEEASTIQPLCDQGRRSSHDQEEAGPQWTEEDPMEPEPPLMEEQGEPGAQWIKEEPEHSPTRQEQKELCSSQEGQQLLQEQKVLCSSQEGQQLLQEQKVLCSSQGGQQLLQEQKELCSSQEGQQLLQEQKVLCSSQGGQQLLQEQKELCSSQGGQQLLQEQSVALMETFALQGGDLSEGGGRTEQLFFQISPEVKSKDQGGSSSTAFENQTRTDAEKRSTKCDICGRTLKYKYDLKLHYRTHTGERPFSCETCCKRFARRSQLTVHYRTHTGERPFTCPICRKSFFQIGHLNVHKNVHTGERPFSCETCGKSFTRRYLLNVHQRNHPGERSRETLVKSF